MAVREVLLYPDERLTQVATPLDLANEEQLAQLAADLTDTMGNYSHCVGLAAPQIAEPWRMIAVDLRGHPRAKPDSRLMLLANPEITYHSGKQLGREGCLSVPELTGNVRRYKRVIVHGYEPGTGWIDVDTTGFEARCLQHEIDHIDGILFLDRVDSLATDVFRRIPRSQR